MTQFLEDVENFFDREDILIKKKTLAEVRGSIMIQILNENQDESIINKKFLEAYTIKEALQVIEILINKHK